MKKLFMSACVFAFLGCAPEGAPQEVSLQVAAATVTPSTNLRKPTLRQVMPQVKRRTPSPRLTAKTPRLKLRPQLTLPRPAPSAI